jgi:hypothetical protein
MSIAKQLAVVRLFCANDQYCYSSWLHLDQVGPVGKGSSLFTTMAGPKKGKKNTNTPASSRSRKRGAAALEEKVQEPVEIPDPEPAEVENETAPEAAVTVPQTERRNKMAEVAQRCRFLARACHLSHVQTECDVRAVFQACSPLCHIQDGRRRRRECGQCTCWW